MDFVRLRLFSDCRLDIDDNDLPLPGIVCCILLVVYTVM
jgi:hypothetical protein